jgi:hypothetical protein
MGEVDMTNTRAHVDWFGQVQIDERNELPLVIALCAILLAWSGVFVVTLA